jgi:hypothetical protein
MLSIKEIFDGLIETILDIPIMFFRTHALVISRGPLGPFLLARRIRQKYPKYLRLRTIAFIEVLILYALSRVLLATNGQGGASLFANTLFKQLPLLADVHFDDPQFVSILAIFLAFYYCSYLLALIFNFNPQRRVIVADACLYYLMLCTFIGGTFIFILLGIINPTLSTTNEVLIRVALVVTYLIAIGQLGFLFTKILKLPATGLALYASIAVCGLASFAVYATIVWMILGREGIWPDLHA